MSGKKSFWQLWKDTLAALATAAIVLYCLNAFLHTFDAASLARLSLTYQVIGALVFIFAWVIGTPVRLVVSRYVRRHARAEPPIRTTKTDDTSPALRCGQAAIAGTTAIAVLLLAIALTGKKRDQCTG